MSRSTYLGLRVASLVRVVIRLAEGGARLREEVVPLVEGRPRRREGVVRRLCPKIARHPLADPENWRADPKKTVGGPKEAAARRGMEVHPALSLVRPRRALVRAAVEAERLEQALVCLGLVNAVDQQKGVDSLIVSDLINLARNRAMSDAVLLTGDEDIRVGVQQAQEVGVRVHLVGLPRTAGQGNQSNLLQQEVDTLHEISATEVATFLTRVVPTAAPALAPPGALR